MWKRKSALGVLSVLLSACGSPGPVVKPMPSVTYTGCNWSKPIYISKDDILTEETADQIQSHNEAGMKICGWKRNQRD